jgi:hypothetical protein
VPLSARHRLHCRSSAMLLSCTTPPLHSSPSRRGWPKTAYGHPYRICYALFPAPERAPLLFDN